MASALLRPESPLTARAIGVLLADYPWPVRTGSHRRDASILSALRGLGPVVISTFAALDERASFASDDESVVHVTRSATRGGIATHAVRRARIGATAFGIGSIGPYSWPFAAGAAAAVEALVDRGPLAAVIMRSFLSPWGQRARRAGPVIVDAHDAEHVMTAEAVRASRGVSRLLGRNTVAAVRRSMQRCYPLAAEVWVPTSRDAEAVREVVPGVVVHVVPNAVELGEPPEPPSERGARDVLFVGNLAFAPNARAATELVDDLLPRLRRRSNADVVVVGRSAGHTFSDRPGLRHVAEVDDVEPYYQAARVALLPVRAGAGSRLKVMECMARGVPVVATTKAVEGLETRPGADVLVGETQAELVDAALSVLHDDALADSLAAAGRKTAAARYGPAAVVDALNSSPALRSSRWLRE